MSYTKEFYDTINEGSLRSARLLVPWVLARELVGSVVDVGCGEGAWLSIFQENGVDGLLGLDGGHVDHRRLLIDQKAFEVHDLSRLKGYHRRFDLAVSLEVAEHLPESSAEGFVGLLTSLSDVVLFSAAIPGQSGANHVNCFPSGTVIEGPAPLGVTSRWFEGDLVNLTFASGEHLSATPNHPVLTSKGWVGIGKLQAGDNVVRCVDPDGLRRVIPNDYQNPTLIQDVATAFRESPEVSSVAVPLTSEDLHGDALNGQICIVRSNGLLGDNRQAFIEENISQSSFTGMSVSLSCFSGRRSPCPDFPGIDLTSTSRTSRFANPAPLFGSPQGKIESVHFSTSPKRDSRPLQAFPYRSAGNLQLVGDGFGSLPCFIGTNDGGVVQSYLGPSSSPSRSSKPICSADIPSGESNLLQPESDQVASASKLVCDLLRRFPFLVEEDQVLGVDIVPFRGHVYNLQTSTGWYVAQGHIVHNCRWPSYWVKKFARRGFGCEDTIRWEFWNDERVEPWYRQNVLIFRKGATSTFRGDVVHPSIYRWYCDW